MRHKSPKDEWNAIDRRGFVKTGVAASVGMMVGTTAAAESAKAGKAKPAPPAVPEAPAGDLAPFNPRTFAAMPTRNLGRTGHHVGIFSLGGQATIEKPGKADESAAMVNRAIDLGVNYIDTAAVYGGPDQWSQKYIGQVMKTRRKEVFLTSKTHLRTYDESMRLLESSLQQLNTDHLDLWQVHNVRETADLDKIFAADGAIKALEKAREQGMVRFLGITGHSDPLALAEGLRRFSFDTILMAVNAADRHYLSFIENLLPLALEQRLGIIGMKIPARSRLLSSWKPTPSEQQPKWEAAAQPGVLAMKEAFDYALSLPVSTVIIGCDDVAQVEENVRLASAFTPLPEESLRAIERRTLPIQRQALFFRKWPV
jgi:uncharacterized protein